jgi:RND family efflux transporter MFP subunit
MKTKGFLSGLLVAAGMVSLVGCGRNPAQAQGQAAMPPPIVTVAPVQEREVTEWSEFTGHTEAVESVEVRPRVSGHIEKVCFQSGQLVRKGDVLFVIDPRWYQADFDQRQGAYFQAQASLVNAQRDALRASRLLTTKAISSEEADAAQSKSQEAQGALLAAKANLESAKLDLDETQVRAPIDGRVSRALLTVGNYVSGTAGSASLLTTIVSVDPIYVLADIDENSYLQFKSVAGHEEVGKVPVDLALENEDGFPHHGWIESFDNRLDTDTGTILLRAQFSNPDGRLVPGLFARIRLPVSARHPAVLVDDAAIGTDQAQKFVLVLGDKNSAEYRKVTLGPEIDGLRVVRTGLKSGEKIIVNGIQRARPGMPVTPQEQVTQAQNSGAATAQR